MYKCAETMKIKWKQTNTQVRRKRYRPTTVNIQSTERPKRAKFSRKEEVITNEKGSEKTRSHPYQQPPNEYVKKIKTHGLWLPRAPRTAVRIISNSTRKRVSRCRITAVVDSRKEMCEILKYDITEIEQDQNEQWYQTSRNEHQKKRKYIQQRNVNHKSSVN